MKRVWVKDEQEQLEGGKVEVKGERVTIAKTDMQLRNYKILCNLIREKHGITPLGCVILSHFLIKFSQYFNFPKSL